MTFTLAFSRDYGKTFLAPGKRKMTLWLISEEILSNVWSKIGEEVKGKEDRSEQEKTGKNL